MRRPCPHMGRRSGHDERLSAHSPALCPQLGRGSSLRQSVVRPPAARGVRKGKEPVLVSRETPATALASPLDSNRAVDTTVQSRTHGLRYTADVWWRSRRAGRAGRARRCGLPFSRRLGRADSDSAARARRCALGSPSSRSPALTLSGGSRLPDLSQRCATWRARLRGVR